jgi:transposase
LFITENISYDTYLGIDVSSDFIHIAYQGEKDWVCSKVENELKSIDEWISTMPDDIHAIFEYTGTYSHRLAYSLSLRERTFSIITPSQSKGFAASLKNKAKTDSLDAKVLALYGSKMQPEPTILTDETLHQKSKPTSIIMT